MLCFPTVYVIGPTASRHDLPAMIGGLPQTVSQKKPFFPSVTSVWYSITPTRKVMNIVGKHRACFGQRGNFWIQGLAVGHRTVWELESYRFALFEHDFSDCWCTEMLIRSCPMRPSSWSCHAFCLPPSWWTISLKTVSPHTSATETSNELVYEVSHLVSFLFYLLKYDPTQEEPNGR